MPGLRNRLFATAKFLFGGEAGRTGVSSREYWQSSKQHLEDALQAHREKRWADAVSLWQTYVAQTPSDFRGHFNLGLALVALERFPEAIVCANRIVTQWPRRAEGSILLARASLHSQSPEHRAAEWRQVVEKFPSSVAALEELGRALVDLDAFAEANEIADRLLAVDRRAGLRLQGKLMAAEQPNADRRIYWRNAVREFPGDMDFRRKVIEAALRAGSLDAAEDFSMLLKAGDIRATDAKFAIGFANIYRAQDDTKALKTTVRSFLKAMPSQDDRRIAALKLSRVIFGSFARKPVASATVPPRFRKLIERAPIEEAPKKWLGRVCDVYDKALDVAPLSLLETDVSRAQCEEFIRTVRARLSAAVPFSLIRLGDAEANAVEYEPSLASHADTDAAERERSWWGRELRADARAVLNRRVSQAIWSADALGIPCVGRVLRDIDLRRSQVLATGRSGRGIRAILHAVDTRLEQNLAPPMFVSFAVHHDLQKFGLYRDLLSGARDVVCVSSHRGLPEVLATKFGVASAMNITLRSAHSLRSTVEQSEGAFVLPEQCDEVIAALGDNLGGRLVIVAAGYVGKLIVQEAAWRGAVALDLGSTPDYWMGKRTRGYLDIA